MKRIFDLGMSVKPYDGKHRHLWVEVYFGGQAWREPEDGYFSCTAQIGGSFRGRWHRMCDIDKLTDLVSEKNRSVVQQLVELNNKHALKCCRCIPEKDAEKIKKIIKM